MVSLYLINKRIVDVDMSCDELLKARDIIEVDKLSQDESIAKEDVLEEPNHIEELDLSFISLSTINEIVYEEVSKSSAIKTQKAIDAYNLTTYKTSLKPSIIIRNNGILA